MGAMSLITCLLTYPVPAVPAVPDNKSKMADSCPSKSDMQLVFKRLQSVNTNKVRTVINLNRFQL